jgi:hypothetical protein
VCWRAGARAERPRDAGEWQAGGSIQFQLDEAGISGDGDCGAVCGSGFAGRRGKYACLSDGEPSTKSRRRPGGDGGEGIGVFHELFGEPESGRLNVVELPDDTLPAVWAPELAAIPGSRTGDKSGIRLLANTIAHQWWGSEVSPMTLNDAWITNGMSRYGELMYIEDENGKTAMKTAIQDVSAGALAYDTTPLSSAGRLSPFSPQFQSMTLEKGAMVFHMLRWEVGDAAFKKVLSGSVEPIHRQGHSVE